MVKKNIKNNSIPQRQGKRYVVKKLPRKNPIPAGWDVTAHQLWEKGEKITAIQATLNQLNHDKPNSLNYSLQVSYYLFLINDFKSAATILKHQLNQTPEHLEIPLNLSVCLSRINEFAEAVLYAQKVLEKKPDNFTALDVLAKSLFKLGREQEASEAGTQALRLKDRNIKTLDKHWHLPKGTPQSFANQPGKHNVISFSLWGNHPRYLRGALQNLLLAEKIYPGWSCHFHIDDSVPGEFTRLMASLGAKLIIHPGQPGLRQKLSWRFRVANEPSVGYFLIRDVDAVISEREARAVAAWQESAYWFHVMRDWWTHTDLVLAGLWGGVANVLPSLDNLLYSYQPKQAATQNIDQWFLRDRVWPLIKQSCLIHDRCFKLPGTIPFPGPIPENRVHIGQDEFTVRGKEQEQLLMKWIKRYPCLGGVLWGK